jgi:hypothetical protein
LGLAGFIRSVVVEVGCENRKVLEHLPLVYRDIRIIRSVPGLEPRYSFSNNQFAIVR